MALNSDKEKCAHILRRFGLGSSEAELSYYLQGGLDSAIDKLLNYEQVDEGYPIDPTAFVDKKGRVLPVLLGLWWSGRLLTTRRPLQEKMTLFWHNHFATSASKDNQAGVMWVQNEIFRKNATGNFRTMLHDVSKDPAMIFWLDTQTDRVGHPNENFAREVMELFTLGIGNYTETDMQQAARAYTGWSFKKDDSSPQAMPYREYIYRPGLHDDTDKTIFGSTANYDGDQVLDVLCDMPQCAKFIVNKLWSMFVYEDPSSTLVDHLADTWRSQNLEIKPLLKTIMTMPEFYSSQAERAIYKSPADIVVTTARQMGVGNLLAESNGAALATQRTLGITRTVYQTMLQQGLQLFFPPNVAGWKQGRAWISSATLVSRIGWGESLFGRSKGRRAQLFFNSSDVFKDETTIPAMVDKLASIFDAPMTSAKRDVLIEAGNKAIANAGGTNANEVAGEICQILFADPDFQFC